MMYEYICENCGYEKVFITDYPQPKASSVKCPVRGCAHKRMMCKNSQLPLPKGRGFPEEVESLYLKNKKLKLDN